MYFAHLHIPEFSIAVHGTSGYHETIGIERNCNYFTLVACVGWNTFATKSVPEFSGLVERASGNFAAIGDIETHAVNRVFMSLKRVNKSSSASVPNFAGSVIAASEELVSILVEAAIRKGEHMSL